MSASWLRLASGGLLACLLTLPLGGCAAPSPPVDAPKAPVVPAASRPVQRDATGTPPTDAATRPAREEETFAVLEGRVTMPSESGQSPDWRDVSLTVVDLDGLPHDETLRRYLLAQSELAACYRRLAATSKKGEAKAKIRVDANGQPLRVEWASGNLAPELFRCAADTLLAVPVAAGGKARVVTLSLAFTDR